jgi:hypothetical protein
LHGRRNTLVKERILPSLQTVNIIVTKIAAMLLTIHLAVMVVIDGLIATVKPPID